MIDHRQVLLIMEIESFSERERETKRESDELLGRDEAETNLE